MFLLLLLTLSTLLAPATSSKQNIVELALATPQLSTLVTALKAASLVDTLTGDGPFTVFAPTNTAFDALLPGVLANLLKPANKAQLSDLLTYHVVSGNIMTSMILDKEMIKTVEGKYVTARKADALTIFINSARITVSNVTASNGVIHFIDAVLVPSGAPPTPPTPPPPAPGTQNIVQLASATPDLSTLVEAVKAAALVDTLESAGPFTVFAPMNEAFAALPAGTLANLLKPKNKAQLVRLLTYHVVQGAVKAADILDGERLLTVEGMYVMCAVNKSGVFINNAQVTTADVMASNGVVHIINQVLLPRSIPPAPPVYKNIVELAIATPSLSTLVTALKAADLVDILSGNGPFTVFAPTNNAFAALPASTLASLLKPENKAQLVALLTYHVAPGNYTFDDFSKGGTVQPLKSVEGHDLNIVRACTNRKCSMSKLDINPTGKPQPQQYEATVQRPTDVLASNGVIHVINHVLTSEGKPPSPSPSGNNHLWFRGFTGGSFDVYQCGEVDAGSRMPAKIFDPSNANALQAYKDITIALFGVFGIFGENSITKLELGRCVDKNYTRLTCGTDKPYPCQKVDWAPEQLMDGICEQNCLCNYKNLNKTSSLPECKDVPDDPKAGKWCSLCGPKVNKPFEVLTYSCASRGFGPGHCPPPDPATPVKDWVQVLKDLLAL